VAKSSPRLYLIPVLSKALDILELLQNENQPMTLEAIHRRTRVSKTTVYRVLKTFAHRGYISQAKDGTYRHISHPKKLRFGFAGQSADMPFSVEVTNSLIEAAAASGVDLMVLDNRYDGPTAVKNAEEFISAGVDLIIEFQVEHEVAPIIGDRIAAAKIPLIAIDIPHPHATFFGVDNYRVGMTAGEALAQFAHSEWDGEVDWVIGLDLPEAGLLVQSRVSGAFEAIRASLPDIPVEAFVRIDGRGIRERSRKVISEFMQRHPREKHILIAAANDSSALGAIDAARDLKRERHISVVGQDCIQDAIEEMRRRSTPLIGSVSHETIAYGPALMNLGLGLLRGQTVPPYNYVTHRLVTRRSLQENNAAASQA
jgi:ribose transport system substrate-binding protein